MEMKLTGMAELEQALLALGDEYGPKAGVQALRPAVRAAVDPIKSIIETTTPRDSGQLAASTKIRIGKPTKKMLASEHFHENMVLVGRVGWTWSGAPSLWHQALAVEFGTTEMSGSATLRNALDMNAEEMINNFGRTLGPAIEKKAKQLHKKRMKGK
ncbi:hypothetical protein EOK75_17150 (plasmid) [Pseudorhodobacter turbinis]|uniref:HK97 gp10 family phage protein n=1 Tax=Pseudorhodobacter turbinis TaxID=2500533 RepID=A0A4P8EJS5_9RHOB|nr:HK97-gp10 family putative phage morphogenesis protein [Pseudorhodobacter turbinis]QCO57441.1 hypothetical protein EOK75_17150 [Pseudorhodobacter turbinis]